MLGPEQGHAPEPKVNESMRFEKAMEFFPDDEKDKAKEYLNVFDSIIAKTNGQETMFKRIDMIYQFCEKLSAKYGKIEFRQFKLFHLIAGSSCQKNDWLQYPLDTPEGEFGNFITEELSTLL